MLATLNNVVPGKFGINYYMCTGEDSSDYDLLEKKASKFYTFVFLHQVYPEH